MFLHPRYGRRAGREGLPQEEEDQAPGGMDAVPVPHSGIPREWADAAREAIKYNHRLPSANRRVWELAGGLLRCSLCGAHMRQHSSLGRRDPDVWYFYYRCAGQWDDGPCTHKKMYRAGEIERRVWEFVCSLLTDPDQLRADLDAMIEQERKEMRGDPDREANTWLDKLSEMDQERRGYQRLAAKGHMTDEELDQALAELEEMRKTAERELETLRGRRERIEGMERARDALLDDYAHLAPEVLDALTPEERRQVYGMLRLRAVVRMDGTLEVGGTFGEGNALCHTQTRCSTP